MQAENYFIGAVKLFSIEKKNRTHPILMVFDKRVMGAIEMLKGEGSIALS